jgi:predicted alpha-1,2-mannosidase
MKKLIFALPFLLVVLACSRNVESEFNAVQYVNPNIGTAHSRWFFYTPAAVPFGMAKLGPTTDGHYGNKSGWEAVGYDYRHTSIEGFAHFHEFQIGGIVFTATSGELQTVPGDSANVSSGYRSTFSHENEVAQPGYYSVILDDYNIKTELTATKRVGFHRYTFLKEGQANLIFDIGNQQGESGKVVDSYVKISEDGKVEGWVATLPEYVKYLGDSPVKMFFSAEVSKAADKFGCFIKEKTEEEATEAKGVGAGAFITYSTVKAGSTVEIKVGLSFTSLENARLNLVTEAKDLNFDAAKQQANSIWKKELAKIKVETVVKNDKIKFYTGLYHALLGRGVASDVNGAYPKADGTIGQLPLDANGKPLFNFINTDAIWGAFWNLTQLWAMAWPEVYQDFIQTNLTVYKDRGWTGDGIANSRYVSGVGTNYISLVTAAAFNCRLLTSDIETAYEASKKDILEWKDRPLGAGKKDLRGFVEDGYVYYKDTWGETDKASKFSASHSLEFCFGAYAVAQFAKALGKDEDYKILMDYADNWQLLYKDDIDFIVPKMEDGSWKGNFNPSEPWAGFQEGNSWQYTFYVPHNIEGLKDKMGKETFNARLDTIFKHSRELGFGGGKNIDAFAGLENYYNHGNQPSLHMSYLFTYGGRPWLTQRWTRLIMDEFYGTEGIHGYGYGQDEDQGQLGAWFVVASLGVFDVKALTDIEPKLQLASPLFEKATIRLGNGNLLEIVANNNSKENLYVQSVSFEGKSVETCWIGRKELTQGGKLVFEMGSQPNTKWGISTPPPSMSSNKQ